MAPGSCFAQCALVVLDWISGVLFPEHHAISIPSVMVCSVSTSTLLGTGLASTIIFADLQ